VTFGRENFRARGLSAACRLFITALACATALIAVGCRGLTEPTPDVRVEHEISPCPPRVGSNTVNLKLTDFAASKPLSGARVRLEGNMTHAGMTPVFADAKEVGPGRYRATLELTMGGDWVVLVHVVRPDGRQVERQVDVKGVRAE